VGILHNSLKLPLLQVPNADDACSSSSSQERLPICSEREGRHRSSACMGECNDSLIVTKIVDVYLTVSTADCNDIKRRRTRAAANRGTPSLEFVNQTASLGVPELQRTFFAPDEDFVQVGVGMHNTSRCERLPKLKFPYRLHILGKIISLPHTEMSPSVNAENLLPELE